MLFNSQAKSVYLLGEVVGFAPARCEFNLFVFSATDEGAESRPRLVLPSTLSSTSSMSRRLSIAASVAIDEFTKLIDQNFHSQSQSV
jgi:hypothetical protein